MRLYRLRLMASRLHATGRALPELAALARWPDHRVTPAAARKPVYHRFLELVYISLRWGEVSSTYYGQGVDRIGQRVRHDYMPYSLFRRIRDSRNRASGAGKPFDNVCLLQDKRLFERYFGAGGLPVLATVCELRPEGVELASGDECGYGELAAVLGDSRSLFCKPRHGIHGHDAFRLDVHEGVLLVDGEATAPESLARRIEAPCLCQERLIQHAALAQPHPGSVNTLRIVTLNHAGTPEVLFASLRIGADGAVTDNAGAMRCIVRVHADTGACYETGFWKGPGQAFSETAAHRQTGVALRDCRVPFYDECLDLVRRAHRWLPGIYSVGWDLAITPDGPRLVEGNDDWSGSTTMNYPEVRRRFLELHGWRPREESGPQPAAQPQPEPHGLE